MKQLWLMRFNQADMGVPFVTCDNIGSSKNILSAEFIHLKGDIRLSGSIAHKLNPRSCIALR